MFSTLLVARIVRFILKHACFNQIQLQQGDIYLNFNFDNLICLSQTKEDKKEIHSMAKRRFRNTLVAPPHLAATCQTITSLTIVDKIYHNRMVLFASRILGTFHKAVNN